MHCSEEHGGIFLTALLKYPLRRGILCIRPHTAICGNVASNFLSFLIHRESRIQHAFFLMRFCIVLPSPHCCFHCSATDFASSSRLADLRNPIHLYSAYCYRLCPYFRYDLNWFDLKRWETFRNYATEPLGPLGPAPKGPTSTHIVTYLFKNPWCPSGTFATQVTMSSVDPGYVSASHSSRAPNCCPKPSSEMTSLCGRRDKLHHL